MKASQYALVVWLILICVSCQNRGRQVSLRYYTTFPLDTAVSVELFDVENKKSVVPHQIWCLGNRLVARGDYNKFNVYSYPSLNFLTEQELPDYAFFNSEGEKIYAEEKGDVDVYLLGEKDTLYKSHSFSIAKTPYSIGTVQQLKPDTYIYPDRYDFRGSQEFHLMNIRTHQRTSMGDYPEDDTRFKRLSDYKSAYGHFLRVKPDKSAFVVIYSLLHRIRIYDNSCSLQHDIFIESPPGNYKVVPVEGELQYWHFGQTYVTDRFSYIFNPNKLGRAPAEPHCNIVVLDWEGNLVARYRLSVWVRDFFVDESKKVLFGSCWAPSQGEAFFSLNLLNL